MTIDRLDFIYSRYHFLAHSRSVYLESAKKVTKNHHISLSLDGNFLCDLESFDDIWDVSFYVRNVLFELVFEADCYLHSFCFEHNLDYDPITYDPYLIWLSSRYQSKLPSRYQSK